MKSQNYNKIIKTLKSKGFKKIELDSVIESKFILQRSGENFRKYLFSFYNSNGQELCLRPDLTISSLLRYAQKKTNSKEKVFYTGSAFRKSYNKKNIVIKQGKLIGERGLGGDRESLKLNKKDITLIKELSKVNKNLVVIYVGSSAIEIGRAHV